MRTGYINGKVFTSTKGRLYAEGFMVEDGRIIKVGATEEILDEGKSGSDGSCEIIDLNGATVIPGIVDAHMHPFMLANYSKQIVCLPPRVSSIEDIIREVKKARDEKGPDTWILGWGYDEGKLAEHRTPNRYDLDKGCSDAPVLLYRTCGHISSVNSKVLELAGITKDTLSPEGGEIGRFDDGEPNGIFYESAERLFGHLVPKADEKESVDNLLDLGKILSSQGVVAVTDMGDGEGIDIHSLYKEAASKGFKQSVSSYIFWERREHDPDFDVSKEDMDHDAPIRVAGLKLIGDGSYSGHTAFVDRPYIGTDNYGISVCPDSQIESAIQFCKKHKCQLSIHAMGELAIKRMLDKVEGEEKWNGGPEPHLRLEHTTEPSLDSMDRAARMGIAFATQPIFFFSEIESYLANLGHERTKGTYPIKTELERGVKVALSTDAPATSWATASDPFINMQAAVTRVAYDGTDCGKQEAIDIETAVELYTREAAEISGFNGLGEIREGFRACFLILSDDLFRVRAEDIGKVRPVKTYIDGKAVYEE